jgi:hypothetical protein
MTDRELFCGDYSCAYDDPATFCRKFYVNGKETGGQSFEFILMLRSKKSLVGKVPPAFDAGKLWGNIKHLPDTHPMAAAEICKQMESKQ